MAKNATKTKPLDVEEDEQLISFTDPAAGGNDNLFLAKGKSAIAEGGNVGLIKTKTQKSPAKQAKEAEGKALSPEELQKLLGEKDLDIRQLLEWLAQQNMELSAIEEGWIESLPEGLRNIGNRRQMQVAIQMMLMLQIQAYFNLQQHPNIATPHQLAANQILIQQLMQLASNPKATPQMLMALPALQRPEIIAAVTQMRQQMQQAGLIAMPLRQADLMLRTGQTIAKNLEPVLQQIQKALEQKLQDPKTSPSNKNELRKLVAEITQLRGQFEAIAKIPANASPQQVLKMLQTLYPVRFADGAQPANLLQRLLPTALLLTAPQPLAQTQARPVATQPGINPQALLVARALENVGTLRLNMNNAALSPQLPPSLRQTVAEQVTRLDTALRFSPAPQLQQQVQSQLAQQAARDAAIAQFNAAATRSAFVASPAAPLAPEPQPQQNYWGKLNFAAPSVNPGVQQMAGAPLQQAQPAVLKEAMPTPQQAPAKDAPQPSQAKDSIAQPATRETPQAAPESRDPPAKTDAAPRQEQQGEKARESAPPDARAAETNRDQTPPSEIVNKVLETGETQRIKNADGTENIIANVNVPTNADDFFSALGGEDKSFKVEDVVRANQDMQSMQAGAQQKIASALESVALQPGKGWLEITDPSQKIPSGYEVKVCPASGKSYAVPPSKNNDDAGMPMHGAKNEPENATTGNGKTAQPQNLENLRGGRE